MSTLKIKIDDRYCEHQYTITNARGDVSIGEIARLVQAFLCGQMVHDGPVKPKIAGLILALQDCVAVMELELKGLAVIQPELRQAKEALASYEAGGDK